MPTVSMRVSPDVRDLIDRAAKATGRTRAAFMLEAARKAAEEALLLKVLDAPPRALPELRKVLAEPAPWEEPEGADIL